MFCPYCGKKIPDDSLICPACRADISEATDPYSYRLPEEPEKKKSVKGVIFITIFSILLVTGALLVYEINSRMASEAGKDPSPKLPSGAGNTVYSTVTESDAPEPEIISPDVSEPESTPYSQAEILKPTTTPPPAPTSLPTPTPTPTPTPKPTVKPTATPTAKPESESEESEAESTPDSESSQDSSESQEPSPTEAPAEPTPTEEPAPTAEPTPTDSPTPTAEPAPTDSPAPEAGTENAES